jgi:hypothetical protein
VSFCYLLNAALLFAGVLGFIVAGFAGTFSRSLYGRRYRLMLGPLGFVVLGSIAHSITARLVAWYSHVHPAFHITHPAGLGSGADIFETVMLLASGIAGVLCGVALGASLDRDPVSDSTYTIANYWNRGSRQSGASAPAVAPRKENVVAISKGRKQHGAAAHIAAISETAISKTE